MWTTVTKLNFYSKVSVMITLPTMSISPFCMTVPVTAPLETCCSDILLPAAVPWKSMPAKSFAIGGRQNWHWGKNFKRPKHVKSHYTFSCGTEERNKYTVNIGFRNHPPSEGSRFLKPARPLKQGSGYSNQVVAKARVWVYLICLSVLVCTYSVLIVYL